jgi:ABC-type multidrug transport system fused ATPase/permease subunit
MLLDEITTGLDNITAHEIEKTIMAMKDLTCIFVTHRYHRDILKECDGILVLRNGTLIENGTYDELYAKKGHFYSLLNLQP